MRIATWNVLADRFMLSGQHGDYGYVSPELMHTGARIPHIRRVLDELRAAGTTLVFLQEVESLLLAALEADGWLTWSASRRNHVGRATLVAPGVDVQRHDSMPPLAAQRIVTKGISIVNAHVAWAPADGPDHPGVKQMHTILEATNDARPTVILGDANDRPGGPVRELLKQVGFTNLIGNQPTAYVNNQPAALDLIAVRGAQGKEVPTRFQPDAIPTINCPSDHIPVLADLNI